MKGETNHNSCLTGNAARHVVPRLDESCVMRTKISTITSSQVVNCNQCNKLSALNDSSGMVPSQDAMEHVKGKRPVVIQIHG